MILLSKCNNVDEIDYSRAISTSKQLLHFFCCVLNTVYFTIVDILRIKCTKGIQLTDSIHAICLLDN